MKKILNKKNIKTFMGNALTTLFILMITGYFSPDSPFLGEVYAKQIRLSDDDGNSITIKPHAISMNGEYGFMDLNNFGLIAQKRNRTTKKVKSLVITRDDIIFIDGDDNYKEHRITGQGDAEDIFTIFNDFTIK